MAISREQVEHVAHLARLGLSDDETDRLQQQLSQILGHMQMIDRLDTSAIPPTAQVIPLSSVMRDDVARPSTPDRGDPRERAAPRGGLLQGSARSWSSAAPWP